MSKKLMKELQTQKATLEQKIRKACSKDFIKLTTEYNEVFNKILKIQKTGIVNNKVVDLKTKKERK